MLTVGDKVNYLGLCYVITKIEGDTASLRILRQTRNPRARKQFATQRCDALKPWNK